MRFIFLLVSMTLLNTVHAQTVSIIPKPARLTQRSGSFVLSKKTVIAARDEEDRKAAMYFNEYLQKFYGFTLDIDKQESKNFIRLSTKKFIKAPDKDAYTLAVEKEGVTISGDTYTGTFYGVQSLIQLLPVNATTQMTSLTIPMVSIEDAPRFDYRGMHLDVGRHFFPVDFIKKYIDYLALHKMNYFHWHLTEDQGWRIEIKKYPKLTETGSIRNGTIIGRYPGKGNDNLPYGGFYTQDEIKHIVQYAADRHITVVPEIEMPGHSSAAIAAYPWLSCFPAEPTLIPATMISEKSKQEQAAGRIKLVQETWGVFNDVFCAGSDSTFTFLQDVIDEVLTLFPSRYVHVGGDECPKANWKRCPRCQQRMKANGLKDEHELQSYFIQRMEKYLNSKGRVLIGWDEILEGGLAPNAVVMSWRGEQGGIDAAKQNHPVIMTPQKPVYFDHSQAQKEDSVVIGGYNPLENVYKYEPIPAALTAAQAKYVLGSQANVWTEYMGNTSKVEYMVFPRMSALSEVLWSPAASRNYSDFEKRLMTQFKRYELWKTNYSKAYFGIRTQVSAAKDNNGIVVSLGTKAVNGKLQYEQLGSHAPITYTKPFTIQKTGQLNVVLYAGNKMTDSTSQQFSFNKATGKKVSFDTPPSDKFSGSGAFTLVDGIQNTKGLNRSGEFIGFEGVNCTGTIRFGKIENIGTVKVHVLHQPNSWIYAPRQVIIKVKDAAGRLKEYSSDAPAALKNGNLVYTVTVGARAAAMQFDVQNNGTIADGKPGAGNPAWVFVDEIEVNNP